MLIPLTRLRETVAAAAPIQGVSVGFYGDPATVEIAFAPEATGPQMAAARAAVAAFDWSAAAQDAWGDAQQPERTTLRQAATQAVTDIDSYLAIGSPTNAQVATQVRRLSQISRAVIRRLAQLD